MRFDAISATARCHNAAAASRPFYEEHFQPPTALAAGHVSRCGNELRISNRLLITRHGLLPSGGTVASWLSASDFVTCPELAA